MYILLEGKGREMMKPGKYQLKRHKNEGLFIFERVKGAIIEQCCFITCPKLQLFMIQDDQNEYYNFCSRITSLLINYLVVPNSELKRQKIKNSV